MKRMKLACLGIMLVVILFLACRCESVAIQNTGKPTAIIAQYATPIKPNLSFWADRTSINQGECTTLHWSTNWGDVWIGTNKHPSVGQMEVCPAKTTKYEAEIGDQLIVKEVIITVQAGSSASNKEPSLDFWVDRTTINKGECTTLHWRTNWGGVWLGEKKYGPEGQMKICPTENTQYNIEIGDQVLTRAIIIYVNSGSANPSGGSQPQQPAAPQPAQPAQPQPPPNPGALEILTAGNACAFDGDPLTIQLSRGVKVDVYVGGVPAMSVDPSEDWRFITFRIPSGRKDDFVEVRGEGLVARKQFNLISNDEVPRVTDLAITELVTDNMPRGTIFAHLTNRGPQKIEYTEVILACGATLIPLSGSDSGWNAFLNKQKQISLLLEHNKTVVVSTDINNESDKYSYQVACNVYPVLGTYTGYLCGHEIRLEESNPANNTFRKEFPFFFN